LAKTLIVTWLNSEFQGGRSQPKVDKIIKIEEKYRGGSDPARKG